MQRRLCRIWNDGNLEDFKANVLLSWTRTACFGENACTSPRGRTMDRRTLSGLYARCVRSHQNVGRTKTNDRRIHLTSKTNVGVTTTQKIC